jgi:hypothetical protein
VIIKGLDIDVPAGVRPLLNLAWNAFGLPFCPLYNAQGGWMGVG